MPKGRDVIPDIFLPEAMAPLVFWALLATSFAGSLITVVFGIGGGGVMLAVLASLIPPAALIPTHGIIQIGSNAGRVLLTLRHVYWPALPAFTLGSILGASVGGALVVNLPPEWVQIGVGSFVLWSVLASPPKAVRDWPGVIGAISSFLTMFFGATGLFVATYTKSHALPRHAHVATHATLMTVQHGLKTLIFGLLGFGFAEWGAFVGAMIAAGFAGTVVGRVFLDRMDDARFKLALNAVLVILSLRLIWAGVTGLLGR